MMKKLLVLLCNSSLFWLLLIPSAVNAQSSSAKTRIILLIPSVIKKYPSSNRAYALIEVGKAQYLIQGNSAKILKTKKISNIVGDMCGMYAAVRMILSNAQMQEQSEGEGSIWKFDGKSWREIAQTSASDLTCKDVKGILKQIRKCLGSDECF